MNTLHTQRTPRLRPMLQLCLALLLGFGHSAQAARLALVVGNDIYTQVSPLKNAGNDARLMASALRGAGFDVSEHQNLDRNRLYDVVDGFQKRLDKGDEVVFYFSGHGVQLDNDPMLLPIDIQANDDKKLRREALPLLYVQDALKDARVSLLVIDACRDNPFPKQGTRTIGDTRGLRPPDVVKGQAIIMSAGRNQKALDNVPGEPGQKNGLFTHEFVRIMRTPGLDVRSALIKVRDDVEDKAARVNHEQRPSLIDDMKGNFYLVVSGGQGGGLKLDDLKKEDENKKDWAQWQARMKADYEQANSMGDAALRAKALERFVQAYPQNNPWSEVDDTLRAQANNTLQSLRTPSQPTQPVQASQQTQMAVTAKVGQVFKDCADCPEMVVIPAGSFTMGSNNGSDDEKPPHQVNIRSFAMGKYEVTQGQWTAVMGSLPPSSFNRLPNRPVEMIAWQDANEFIGKLNKVTGRIYRLPTEAEWEYAARGGSDAAWHFGDNSWALSQYAHYGAWIDIVTQEVGQKKSNQYGLFDIYGNVREWVEDCPNSYIGAPTDGSADNRNCNKKLRVVRGGHWGSKAEFTRSSSRNLLRETDRDNKTGFRVVMSLTN